MSGSDLPVGCELLGYRVERLLGRGGMGVVYLAEDVRLRRRVALKVLAPSLAEDGRFRERFLAESKLAASLDHPCVVPIFEAGEAGGLLFIAMRYVEGGDLKAQLPGPLAAEWAVRVCAQVAEALDFAHGRGLVHRDVKPSNVLLDGRDHVYLADFGLTRRLGEAQAAEPGALGTIDYAAPEQIRGERVDGRADQYSLACLLYECLVGVPPFSRSTDAAVLFAHLEEPPPEPPGLEVVMQTGLAKAPGDRYASCGALVLGAAQALGIVGASQVHLPELPFLLAGVVCPFKGLAAFDRSDAEYFCGRERVVSEVVARLAGSPLVGILGPSGIGKSSLLRAGVLPALSAGVLPGSAAWRQVLLRPGEHPGAELRRVLGGEQLSAAVARLAPGERMVVAVDQLEELFTNCESEPERAAFVEELVVAASDPDRRALVLGSLRADFYGHVASYPEFAQLLSGDHVLVGPMDRGGLERAIVEPASRAGLEVESRLLDALVSDVAGEPGALPLLSTMLLELWQARDGRTLRYESYSASGGVRGAVARLAERAFIELGEQGRVVARSVMLRLVRERDGVLVRRRTRLSELHQIDGAEGVLAAFTEARLVTVGDGEIEVSHEALLQEWPRYRDWLEEDRVGRRLHAHLTTTAQEWDVRGRDPGDLYRGARLTAAQTWAAQHGDLMTALERDFLDASDQEAQLQARRQLAQNRRLRRVAVGAGLLFVLALAAGVFAEIQRGSANQRRRTAESLQLAASAQATLAADPELSALLALRGLRVSATDQAAQALRDALSQLRVRATLRTSAGVTTAAFSPDGKDVATASVDGTARIWRADSHKQIAVLSAPAGVSADNLAFSPDGRLIVTAQSDGNARIWSASSHRPVAALRPDAGGLMLGATFSPDGRTIVTASSDGIARIWSTASHRQLAALPGPADGATPAFSPDGKEIITAGGREADAQVFSTSSRKRVGVIHDPGNAPFTSVAFSSDGRKIVTSSTNATARIWSARSHKLLVTVTEPGDNRLYRVGFSPDGKEIVTASQDRTARVWSASTGRQLFVLAGHTDSVESAAFSPNGRTIVTASLDGTAKLWNAAPLEQLGVLSGPLKKDLVSATFIGDTKRVVTVSAGGIARIWSTSGHPTSRLLITPDGGPLAIAVSPDATKVVTIGQRGSARVWSADSHRQLGTLRVPDGLFRTVAFSPDGKEILTLSGSGAQIWSVGSQRQLGVLTERGGAFLVTAAFSRDGNKIAGVDADGGVQVWSARSGSLLGVISVPPTVGIHTAVFSPDGDTIVTAGYDGTARIWSTTNRRQIGVLSEPNNSDIRSAAFDPSGTKIVTAGADGTARIWSVSTGKQLTVVTEPTDAALNSAAFSPDGNKILTASTDGTARIWSAEFAGPAKAIEQIAQQRVTRQLAPGERKAYLAGT